jgi:hypothetical protein
MKTLAEQLFEFSDLEMELFEQVNKILGSDISKCTAPDFVWGAVDTGFDEYDSSVEVIRPNDAEYMSREQANQILDLGFGRIYESCGTKCRAWDKTSHFETSPRESAEILRLKAKINKFNAVLDRWKGRLESLESIKSWTAVDKNVIEAEIEIVKQFLEDLS